SRQLLHQAQGISPRSARATSAEAQRLRGPAAGEAEGKENLRPPGETIPQLFRESGPDEGEDRRQPADPSGEASGQRGVQARLRGDAPGEQASGPAWSFPRGGTQGQHSLLSRPSRRCGRNTGTKQEDPVRQRGSGCRGPEGDSDLARAGESAFSRPRPGVAIAGGYHGADSGTADRRTLFEVDPF